MYRSAGGALAVLTVLASHASAQLAGPFTYAELHGGAFLQTRNGVGAHFTTSLEDGLDWQNAIIEEEDKDLGFAVGAKVGRQMQPWLGFELEYTLRVAPLSEEPPVGDSDIETHALFVNQVFRWPTTKPIEPYLGIGVGYLFNNYAIDLGSEDPDAPVQYPNLDNGFAGQVFTGADLYLSDSRSLGVEVGYHLGQDFNADLGDGVEYFVENGGASFLLTAKMRF